MHKDSTRISLVTGGAGFIGSHLVDFLISQKHHVIVVDKLTYAGNVNYLASAKASSLLSFYQMDIGDTKSILSLLHEHCVNTIYHLAAESHVDNSIEDAAEFIQTNVVGTFSMLNASLQYWGVQDKNPHFRFIHVSTDEVFGHLTESEPPFTEDSPYKPNSPYSASKAASDHLARAWYQTYKLPVITTHCSNNYGPRQHAEKLIPTIIRSALLGKEIPIYGTGRNIRDWIFVKDHCKGLYLAAQNGKPGESYCFGGNNEKRNLELAHLICTHLDKIHPRADGKSYASQIAFVEDRKGHDWRYAIDNQKSHQELGFVPERNFDEYITETLMFYLDSNYSNVEHKATHPLCEEKSIDLASLSLNFEGFRALAQNPHINSHERIGFPSSYRAGFEVEIANDIELKFNHLNCPGRTLLDIGCGASPLTSILLERFYNKGLKIVLNDSKEMLAHIDKKYPFQSIEGKFPDCLDKLLKINPEGYDYILCYSVLHYIMVDTNLFNFIDAILQALKNGGIALIGDIPNISKRKRFFSSEAGINFHKQFMNTQENPRVDFLKIEKEQIDDAILNSLVDRARASGFDAYLIPQHASLPMSNRRDDLIIMRP